MKGAELNMGPGTEQLVKEFMSHPKCSIGVDHAGLVCLRKLSGGRAVLMSKTSHEQFMYGPDDGTANDVIVIKGKEYRLVRSLG
jgi:hypothetical protein